MTYGTWASYKEARELREADAKGIIGLREEDLRRCTRCIVMWHLSTPMALGNLKLNHLLNERYFSAHVLGPSPLTLLIYFVFILSLGLTLGGVL